MESNICQALEDGEGGGDDGGGGDGSGGEGGGGEGGGKQVPDSLKALAGWASSRAKGSRAVDGGLWLAAGSLLATNIAAGGAYSGFLFNFN